MTPAPEKAAPIPADVLALATTIANEMRQANTLYGAEQRIARAIMQDRADQASQEERIREDERAEGADEADMIIAAGRGMAARIGAEFVIDQQKLADFRARLRGGAS